MSWYKGEVVVILIFTFLVYVTLCVWGRGILIVEVHHSNAKNSEIWSLEKIASDHRI